LVEEEDMEYLYYEQEIGSNRSMLRGHLLVSMIGLEERATGEVSFCLLMIEHTYTANINLMEGLIDRAGRSIITCSIVVRGTMVACLL